MLDIEKFNGMDAEKFLTEVVAKAGDLIDRVYREDRATMVVVSTAVRLLRLVAARIASSVDTHVVLVSLHTRVIQCRQ